MQFEYMIPLVHADWQGLEARDLEHAERKLLAMGPSAEEARLRQDGKVVERPALFGWNAGVKCDRARGPCACGAWH